VSLIILEGFLLSAGCQASPLDSGTQPFDVSTPTSIVETLSPTLGGSQMTPSAPTDPRLQELIEKTKDNLANRLAKTKEEVSLIEVTEVEWSDSSLDCPQPGMEYLQVITPGYRIVLQVNDQSYEYHTNKNNYFVYCENRVPPILPKP
jgi:hypothetical protein